MAVGMDVLGCGRAGARAGLLDKVYSTMPALRPD
jgi:hypothetical protein